MTSTHDLTTFSGTNSLTSFPSDELFRTRHHEERQQCSQSRVGDGLNLFAEETNHSSCNKISKGPVESRENLEPVQDSSMKTYQPGEADGGKSSEDLEKQMRRGQEKDEVSGQNDAYIVGWNGEDDRENPRNFAAWKKWLITASLGSTTLTVTFASSEFSTATTPTAMQFGVSPAVMVLGTSLFVLGFAFGPIVFGPLSELYGRKAPLFFGLYVFAIFQIPVAVAQNLQTIFICRFLGGFFSSAPLAIIGGVLHDMFDLVDRGVAVAIFAGATFIGPVLGPIIGGFITMSYLGWRWTEYVTLIMSLFFTTVAFIIVPETSESVLLQRRAKKLRYQTKNWTLHSKAEEREVSLKDIAERYLLRPFKMLALEPILVLITLYMGFIYGFIYLCFEAYPIAFQEDRGWNLSVGALPFVAVMIGVIFGVCIIAFTTKTRFKRKLHENGHIAPEERLVPMMIGSVLLPVGMFWFAWTANPGIIWVPQVLSGIFTGAGVMLIFTQGLSYVIDVYSINANSAIAANCFFRSFLGAGFPMFATGMFHNLRVPWAMSLLGFLTAALFPVPILFYVYGAKIRKWSKYSSS